MIPPIIGKYLFRTHSTNVHDLSLPHLPGYRSTREPYTEASLAKAIRDGIGPNGRALSDLMPRYALDDTSMAALVSYLTALSSGSVPGVTDDVLHFATIITPDADPIQRKGMLDVMQRFFADKNEFIRGGVRPMRTSREIQYRVSRRWQLHVWELTGAPDDWERQLRHRLAMQPVLAVISGLGRRTWAPIHHFCQSSQLPCLLPNVDLPVVAESDFYPVYFSRGVLLEADLILQRIERQRATSGFKRVIQVFRRDDIGEAAAGELERALRRSGMSAQNRMLDEDATPVQAIATALKDVGPGDMLVLWLRNSDVAALPPAPPAASALILSGLMAGLERAPMLAQWRAAAELTYPVDLPELRKVRMNFPLAWFKIRHIEVVAERVQTDTYIACGILAETLTDMLDSFVPDYLVERVEVMLSHRLVNGYYPRLSLGQGQRFASKGGYMVHFEGSDDIKVATTDEWLVP